MVRTLILAALLCLVSPALAQHYTITELDAPPGATSHAAAINARGDVAGWITVNGRRRAALWLIGRPVRPIGPEGGPETWAVDLNDRLQAVVQTDEPGGRLWDWGVTRDLAGVPLAINNAGTILYQPAPVGLPWLRMNDHGDRIASTWDGPLLRKGLEITLLVDAEARPPLSRPYDYFATDLNNRGHVLVNRTDHVGFLSDDLMLWREGVLIPLRHGDQWGAALSDHGAVVGTAWDREAPETPPFAFLWTAAAGLVNLQERATDAAGWRLAAAVDVNNAGQIVGNGFLHGEERAFKLTPARVSASGVNP